MHSISSHGEEYGHLQAGTVLVTDSQSENEGEREKKERKKRIALCKVWEKLQSVLAKTKCRSPGKPTQRPPDKHWQNRHSHMCGCVHTKTYKEKHFPANISHWENLLGGGGCSVLECVEPNHRQETWICPV